MDHLESFWQELDTAALLGSLRRPFRPQLPGGELGRLIEEPQDRPDGDTRVVEDSEGLLLRAVAVTALHRLAGRLPSTGAPARLLLCPADDLPRCSHKSGACLERILQGGQAIKLLREWAQLAAANGRRVREEQLPSLLEKQQAIAPFRADLLPVLGERGRWLAAQNPDWNTFRWFHGETVWFEGSQKERLAFLSDQRAHDPHRARALLESTWEQETPANRVFFLQVLDGSLSMADEPFLESALDDRRAEVRQATAGLLARLPQARLVERMTRRARRLLAWKPGLLRSTLVVNLPETCPDDLLRDGITSKLPTNFQMGEKAWWLAQILAVVPPLTWSGGWNRRPAALLEMASKHEHSEALLFGWTEAALRHVDAEWLEALLSFETHRADPRRMFELFTRLPETMRDREMVAMLRDGPSLSYDQPASVWLSACRFPWSRQLTEAVTRAICRTLEKGDFQPWRWEILMREIGIFFHADLLEQAAGQVAQFQQKRARPDPYARDLLAVLHFRLEMRRSFEQD